MKKEATLSKLDLKKHDLIKETRDLCLVSSLISISFFIITGRYIFLTPETFRRNRLGSQGSPDNGLEVARCFLILIELILRIFEGSLIRIQKG